MAKPDRSFGDTIWSARKDAHQLHHKIADFILHKDTREHPPGLRNLVARYQKLMADADAQKGPGSDG